MAENLDFRLPFNTLVNYVPQNLRNPVVTSLIDNLFDRFLTHDESVPLYGYVGRSPASLDDRTPRVPQPDVERDINTIIPVLNFKVGAERVVFTVQDLMRKAEALGVSPGSWQWLYSQGNNYLPPINLDKFTNFFNYYWVAKAVTTLPDMPWNTELLPEYYTIAPPLPSDLNKLNVVAASTTNTVLTGTGFNQLSFELSFTDPENFTIAPIGSLGSYTPVQSNFAIGSSQDVHIDYIVSGPRGTFKLVEFNVVRDEIIDQYGNSVGLGNFEAGDKFIITPTFLTRNYTVEFVGAPGVKGKITKVKSLNEYQRLDDVQLREGDRVLIKNNSVFDDGIYIVTPGNWVRAEDFSGETAVADARVFVKNGTVNGGKLFKSLVGGGGFGWQVEPGVTESNTNQWQEGNYWVRGEDLSSLGLARADVIQAVRPIIEYSGDIQLNAFINGEKPGETGTSYRQVKTEFNQLPLFDLFRYDGTHAGLVSSVFYYEEDLTADLDLKLQKRVLKSTNDSADFIFNHGMVDEDGQLLFIKRSGELKTIWHPGYIEPTIIDVTFGGAGNGALEGLTAHGFTQQQVWTLTYTGGGVFNVAGSKLPVLNDDTAAVGELYDNGEFSVTIQEGTVPFEPGDTFLFRVGNLESPRYVYRDENDRIFDLHGGPAADAEGKGAWQVPRTFYNNPYNESRSPVTEGVLYSHFRGILTNQVEGKPVDNAFGGSVKLWSEQQTLLAALLMQRDLTPISMIDLAQRQYETALNSVRDIYQQHVVQFLAENGPVTTSADVETLLTYIQAIRASDNDVRTVLYDTTSPLLGFPPTLPQLGISTLVQPAIGFDLVLGRMLLTHHDGHKSLLFEDTLDFRQTVLGNLTTLQIKRSDGTFTPAVGSFTTAPERPYKGELWIQPDGTMLSYDVDYDSDAPLDPQAGALWYKRSSNVLYAWSGAAWVAQPSPDAPWTVVDLASTLNSLLLHVETKLHAGINPNARKYDFSGALEDAAFKAQLKKELFSFAAINGYDPLAPDYNAADAFTWNYSQADTGNLPPLSTSTVPARWHDLLKAHQATVSGVIPTERPNLEPWKLLGFADGVTWWDSLTTTQRTNYTSYLQLEDLGEAHTNGGSVRAVKTDGGITPLTGLQVIDGVTLMQGDRVLLQNEVSPENNGIWVASATNWVRASVPLVQGLYVTATSGYMNKDSTWVLSATVVGNTPVIFKQARMWSSQLWDDIKAARPGLKLSVNARTDALLPPYVSSTNGWSINALTTFIPPGASLGYEFGQNSPVEAVWRASLEYQYSLARALFRYDPLAFLGFCWGFNWVEVDGILYDGFDMNAPGHKRFRLHGDLIDLVERSPLVVVGSGGPLVATYTAYDDERRQNFTVSSGGEVIGYAQEGAPQTIGGVTFTIEDEGRPFRIGDRFEINNGTATFIPVMTYQFMGFGQTFTQALRETSIDTAASYAIAAYREWDVHMGYRAGGLVATDDLQVYTDSETLSSSAFDLLFKRNQIARNEWVQALRVSVVQVGAAVENGVGFVPTADAADWVFRVEGYNPRYLDITYYTLDAANLVSFYALNKAHSEQAWYQPTVVNGVTTTTLPLTITGLQNVVDFLFGYARYLEDRGWEFNKRSEFNVDAETGRVRNFQLEVEKLIDRCYAGITLEQGHVINPFIDRAWFNQEKGLLSPFIDTALFDITGHTGVFDTLGVKYKTDDLDVVRTNLQSSFAAAGPMFSAHVQLDEFEHIFIFNYYSQPSTGSGRLYDPFSGGRVVTYKFNGRKQASETMRPEFGGHFLVNNEVRQNMQASTDNVAVFYDANRAFENETTTKHALALLGFNSKDYFDNLDISNKTQFNFWRGLVQAKGTNMSIDAYLNNNRFDDAKIDEYWAYKVAQYGDARQRAFPELKLSVSDALTQFTQLQFDSDTLAPDFATIHRFDEDRWFSLDDMDQDAHFVAEVVGTYALPSGDAVIGELYELPFIADKLVGSGFEKINATTIKATGPVTITGYGPARPRFNPIKLFNYVSNELVTEIPLWNPATGQHTPTALESINIISDVNPARYNYSTQVVNNNSYDPLRPWGAKEVGRVWFDTRNLDYIPYYDGTIFPSLPERLSRWGTLADYATVDVYEWVQSTVPPAEYNVLALAQAGNADLDPATKAAGQVANQQTYVRDRQWAARPIAWSYSPIPVNVDWEATPPFGVQSFDARLFFDTSGVVSLDVGSFDDLGIAAGMRIGAWYTSEVAPRPVSEYIIEDAFTRTIIDFNSEAELAPVPVVSPIQAVVEVTSTGATDLSGQLIFSAQPLEVHQHLNDEGELIDEWDVSSSLRVSVVNTGEHEDVLVAERLSSSTANPTISLSANEVVSIDVPGLGLRITITVLADGSFDLDTIAQTIEAALGADVGVRNAVLVTPIIENPSSVLSPLSNDPLDNAGLYGWRAWSIPTQAELDADGRQPNSSWKPYVGEFQSIEGNITQVQDAIAYAENPLTLNDGTVIERYQTSWTDWSVLKNTVLSRTQVTAGSMTFTHSENIDAASTSVYVNGIAQLKSAFTISGKELTVSSVPAGSKVAVIIRKYEPTTTELAFDPELRDDLTFQQQFKQDYEYVSLPVRDRDGSLSSTLYYFWVKNKTTPAAGKKLSVQSITQELRNGPANFLTFQNFLEAGGGEPYRYDAITISGLSYIVTKDDTFKLRFTRNFTLRDDPEELNLKEVHTEWTLIRKGQKTRIPEALWRKLTDSVAGVDAAGNVVPAIRRVLYDERHGTRSQFGFGSEQTLAPAGLLRSSMIHTILNTGLLDTSTSVPIPDYITFLNFDESETWFSDATAARKTMTDIWNQAKVSQVNEIFFSVLSDILAANYELEAIFKTSRLSAYSIKVVRAAPVEQTYE